MDTKRLITPIAGFESDVASLYIAQLDDLSRRLRADVDDATPQQLEWQAAPGMNTVGMLLAHMAIAEVFWATVIAERAFVSDEVLGIGADDDGMPCPEGGAPPPGLMGKPLSYFLDLLLKAREHTHKVIAPLETADLTRPIEHRRRDGIVTLNGHWILYHMVEHFGGHYGQVNLLLHLHRMTMIRTVGSS